MKILIVSICCLQLLGWRVFLNSFFYAFYRKGCRFMNDSITVRCSRLIFAFFKQYFNFSFLGETNLLNELPEQYLILANHQSILDIAAFMKFLGGKRVKFVAKSELGKNIPMVSVILKSGNHCLVKRTGSPSQAMQAIDKFSETVKRNNFIPIIFPEGTRSKTGALGTFHPAGFRRFMSAAAMPVAICALDGAWQISSVKSLVKNLGGGSYKMKILKIYPPPTTKAEQLKILEEGKILIQEQLELWRKGKNEK